MEYVGKSFDTSERCILYRTNGTKTLKNFYIHIKTKAYTQIGFDKNDIILLELVTWPTVQ